jgi:hypothetical protein
LKAAHRGRRSTGSHDPWRSRKLVDSIEHLNVLASMAESLILLDKQLDYFVGVSDSSIEVAGEKS